MLFVNFLSNIPTTKNAKSQNKINLEKLKPQAKNLFVYNQNSSILKIIKFGFRLQLNSVDKRDR